MKWIDLRSSLIFLLAIHARAEQHIITRERATVYHHGNVYTVDTELPSAQAFVVKNGWFVDVGRNHDILKKWKKHGNQYVNLRKRTVVPGLVDAHGHFLQFGHTLNEVNLLTAKSIDDVRKLLKEHISKSAVEYKPEGPWLLGHSWNQNNWPGGQFPTAKDLDQDPELAKIPISLTRVDSHAIWVNGAVLDIMKKNGFDESAPVAGGEVIRSPGLGVFVDNAQQLVLDRKPPYTEEQNLSAVRNATSFLHSVGFTGVHDAGVSPSTIKFFRRIAETGDWPLRSNVMVFCHENSFCGDDIEAFEIEGKLKVRSVKMLIDGALGSWGAALIRPYSDNQNTRGILRSDVTLLAQTVDKWIEKGFQVATHAIGDLGNKLVLDAYELALGKRWNLNETIGSRWNDKFRLRIEHAQILTEQDIRRVGELGIIPSVQPRHATSDMAFAEKRLGPERILGAYAWQSLLNASVPVLPLGSDFPVEWPSFLQDFYAAITRDNLDGTSPQGPNGWFPKQKLTREQALKGFTIDAAYASFSESELGSITPMKRADFVVFEKDIMKIQPNKIPGTKITATVVGGKIVYGGL
ncbi:hypothetical protein K493DRAFT_330101 [Basidiobolus meristosporus CBS 931.73]|uniref:Amidohydrolase 3 domain-containing protein n=1 Tax=Basidiobolus meristosporus CBS 931.73 TaxID=1314790 RepID=A0A1Y1Y6N7_9FUNG|nr:hypothetical protein K493DRAFT_330101 [Basidiobolus meristosporus CBS 931.73]|eukprot:ORX93629.1 hypothetical protein K493DRAFT_330101 [Basidiobolus meristosporus CBS 931.73]